MSELASDPSNTVSESSLRVLLGERAGAAAESEIPDLYPWPAGRRWVRAMMVTTLDGAAAGPDGLSGSISSDADKAVFDGVRQLADVILVGAHTIRAEQYGPVRAAAYPGEVRAAHDLAEAPVLVTVSVRLDLPWDLPLFAESTIRPMVFTAGDPDPEALAAAREHAEVVVLDGPRVDPIALLDILEERGLRRIECEGGPTFLNELLAAGLVDEADITVSPTFSGTGHSPQTSLLPAVAEFHLVQVLLKDGFLMNRYLKEQP